MPKQDNPHYTMKALRCYHATVFIQRYTEAQVLKLTHLPDNPLQHTDIETTRKYYAAPGSDDIHEARERLFKRGLLNENDFNNKGQQPKKRTRHE